MPDNSNKAAIDIKAEVEKNRKVRILRRALEEAFRRGDFEGNDGIATTRRVAAHRLLEVVDYSIKDFDVEIRPLIPMVPAYDPEPSASYTKEELEGAITRAMLLPSVDDDSPSEAVDNNRDAYRSGALALFAFFAIGLVYALVNGRW